MKIVRYEGMIQIYTTKLMRDRLILELLTRGEMRIDEILKLTPAGIDGIKIILLS